MTFIYFSLFVLQNYYFFSKYPLIFTTFIIKGQSLYSGFTVT